MRAHASTLFISVNRSTLVPATRLCILLWLLAGLRNESSSLMSHALLIGEYTAKTSCCITLWFSMPFEKSPVKSVNVGTSSS